MALATTIPGFGYSSGKQGERKQPLRDLAAEMQKLVQAILEAVGNCARAAGAVIVGYHDAMALDGYAIATPEPAIKSVAAVLSPLRTAFLRGSSVWGDVVYLFVGIGDLQERMLQVSREAVLQFRRLRED
jgi:hypothetical protein